MLPKSYADFESAELARQYLLSDPINEIFLVRDLKYLQNLDTTDSNQISYLKNLFDIVGALKVKSWKNVIGVKSLDIKTEKPHSDNDVG